MLPARDGLRNTARRTPLPRRVTSRLDDAVRESPADDTEIVWLETRRQRAGWNLEVAAPPSPGGRAVLIRVREGQRYGHYRTGGSSAGELAHGIRMALASARHHPRSGSVVFTEPTAEPAPFKGTLLDRGLARLAPESAVAMVRGHAQEDEAALLDWGEASVYVCNSRGLCRRAHVTVAHLQARSGEGPGAGFASHAARSCSELDPAAIFARARSRRTSAAATVVPHEARPLLLAPEATAALVGELSAAAFSADAYRSENSLLRQHLGVQVFDQSVDLRDDATDPACLPFPFDLEGVVKRPVGLIERGVPRTPALDVWNAFDFGLESTGHAVGGGEAQPGNLVLGPGDASEDELLRAADGGLWIGRIDRIECFDRQRVLFRAHARGVRTIRDGQLDRPTGGLLWQDSLLRVFSDVRRLGRALVCAPGSDGILGGIAAPAMLIREAAELRGIGA